MKIAFLHYHLKTGGVTTVIRQQIEAIQKDCETLAISSGVGAGMAAGVGIGFVIPDDCKDCEDMKGQQKQVIEKRERVYVVNALLRC